MGYNQFTGADAVNQEIAQMGLDTSRSFSLQGDGLLNEIAPSVKPAPTVTQDFAPPGMN